MKIFFNLFFIFLILTIKSQEPYNIHYTINDGLPTNKVYSSYQNSNGTVWFATDVGLVKFNGNKFSLFTTEDGLTDNEVFHVKKDYKGRKWLLTLNGKPSFIYKNKVYNDKNSSIIKKIKSKSLLTSFYEENKTIYISSRKGNISVIDSTGNVTNIKPLNANTSGIWKRKDSLYVLNSGGIYNLESNSLNKLKQSKFPFRVFHQENKIFFSDFNILKQIDSNNRIKEVIKLPVGLEIINIYLENNNKIWVCTRKGVFLYHNSTLINNYYKNRVITSINKNHNNNYWVTTLNNGVLFIPSLSIFQKKLNINTIAKKNNNEIWFGGFKNDYYIKKNNRFSAFSLNKEWRKDVISKIRFFDNESYIIGKIGTKKINHFHEEILSNLNDLLVSNDSLFVASTFTFGLKRDEFELINTRKIYDNPIFERRTNVLSNAKNEVFLGTNVGLYKYSNKKKLFFLGKNIEDLKSSINDILFDKNNNLLLVATSSKGVLVMKKDSVIFKITDKLGLNNNTVNGISKIKENEYLIATNKGPNKIKLANNKFIVENYNPFLGFNNVKTNDINFVNDTIYLAADKKLIYFGIQVLKQIKPTPKILIDEFFSNNYPLENKNKTIIPYNKNNVKIKYSSISFLDKGNVDFYYRLNKGDWTKTKQREVNFRLLDSNSYIFEVFCVNRFNIKSDVKKINFRVSKPFWEKWWFLLIISIFFISIIYLFIKMRIKYSNKQLLKEKKSLLLEKENVELENQMLALEQKALRLQMNPHFIFNALNTIKGYYSEGNTQEASDYISNFSKLLRLLLENVDQYIPLSIEVEMLNLYLHLTQVRYSYKFLYQINISKKLNENDVLIPTLLVQPILENAILHGVIPKKTRGFINTSFIKNNEDLHIIIEDNGVGRKESQKNKNRIHKSKALKITRERLDLIKIQEKKECSMDFIDLTENNLSIGTKVIIKIPLLKNS